MLEKMLLTNRTINTADLDTLPRSWYAPSEYLRGFKSVLKVELWDTSSSGGDWSGYFIQRLNGRSYLIPFSQDDNYPRAGYTLYTGDIITSWMGNITEEEVNNMMVEYTTESCIPKSQIEAVIAADCDNKTA